jgi:hypothetical protein
MHKNIVDDTNSAHPANIQEKLVDQHAEGLRELNPVRDRVLARLWELANLSPEATRGSIAGQIKAMTMIVAIEGLIPDRRRPQAPSQPAAPPPKPQIYVAEWLREQKEREARGRDREAEGMQPGEVVAATAEAPQQSPTPGPAPSQKNELSSRPERSEVEGPAVPASPNPDQNQTSAANSSINSQAGSWVPDAATGTIFDATDPRAPLWMRMKKRRRR